ncbi:hypothetical protein Vadar_029181 [Vaccinium darrowii]|uniref:Uncharacterized protein n=1 Tax=Vaccinium darrowii TaxID=229202 RepID=A0ACB7ZER2_9ERIC|nr:hypothetical protein Vadar_029181 [Vaccinium darrowii]
MYKATMALVQSQDWFYISVVYGFNKPVERRLLWNDLRTLYGLLGSDAWLLLGDFNSIRTLSDRVGSVSFDGIAAHEFNSCLEDIDMEDMASKGFLFTWTNRRGGLGFVKSRIDRALINSRWQVQYPESEAVFQAPGMSDHCPIVVTILRQQSRRIPFKFFNFWMSHDKFSSLLDNAWSGVVHGNPMVALSHKMRNLKFLLKDFNKEFYSDIQKRVSLAKEELDTLQCQCFSLPFDPALHEMEKASLLRYTTLVSAEEEFYK